MQTPTYFSDAVHGLLKDIGIELEKLETYYDQEWHRKARAGRRRAVPQGGLGHRPRWW